MFEISEFDALSEAEKALSLQNVMIAAATDGADDDRAYKHLRQHFMHDTVLSKLLPHSVRTCRDLRQFWGHITRDRAKYAERRAFLYAEFQPLLDALEGKATKPSDASISDRLSTFDPDGVHAVWTKALERRSSDPDGAITSARTLLETVCKHILDARAAAYDLKADLPELYRLTSNELRLAPGQHTEETFKKILGGVTSVVNELGSLRNRLGDAHGQGKQPVKPGVRHAELAVNLAGSIALFLVDTFNARAAASEAPQQVKLI